MPCLFSSVLRPRVKKEFEVIAKFNVKEIHGTSQILKSTSSSIENFQEEYEFYLSPEKQLEVACFYLPFTKLADD